MKPNLHTLTSHTWYKSPIPSCGPDQQQPNLSQPNCIRLKKKSPNPIQNKIQQISKSKLATYFITIDQLSITSTKIITNCHEPRYIKLDKLPKSNPKGNTQSRKTDSSSNITRTQIVKNPIFPWIITTW